MNEIKEKQRKAYYERYKGEFINYFEDTVERLRISADQISEIDPSRGEHIRKMWGFLHMMCNHLKWVHLDNCDDE